jgi:6-pyruvoyltetrahydropterin/6-carboxytetrahydropterin synthase
MAYQSTKTFGHDLGLSCAFRQWRAESHCHFVHGYSIAVKLTFEARSLDYRNWVVDFGGLKEVKEFLQRIFDHKTVVAHDDPHLDYFKQGHELGVLDLVVIQDVGCEKFAELVHTWVTGWLTESPDFPRVQLVSVEVKEHGANSALYTGR